MTSDYFLGGAEAQPKHPNTTTPSSSSSLSTSAPRFSGVLVSNQKRVPTATQRHDRRRAFGWAARSYNNKLFGERHRIGRCAKYPITSTVALKRSVHGTVHTSGLQQCGSVHACPPCAAKIRHQRAVEINRKAEQHIDAGGGLIFLTVTLPHNLTERLADLWDVVAKAWSSIIGGKQFYGDDKTVGAKKKFGIAGFIRSFDLTHNPASGWHPHLHVLIFLDKPVNEFQDEFWEIAGWFRRRWITRIANMTGKKVDPAFGVDVRSVKTSAGIGTYVSKINYELARSDLKKGRGGGSRTPFQILEDAIDNDHPSDRRLWREYVHASKRRHTITVSPYLKKTYPTQELTDEEIASQEQEGKTELLIDNDIWLYLMRHHRPAIISLIHAQQHHDVEASFRVVARYIGWCRLDTRGDIPHINTNTKETAMTINQLHVNTGGLKFRFIKAAEHYEWTDGNRSSNQTRHPDTGQPLWKVTVTILSPDTADAATGTVTVPASEKPEAAFDSEIDFEGLTVRFWSRNGQLGQSFVADAIKTTKPSKKPSVAPATGTAN